MLVLFRNVVARKKDNKNVPNCHHIMFIPFLSDDRTERSVCKFQPIATAEIVHINILVSITIYILFYIISYSWCQ